MENRIQNSLPWIEGFIMPDETTEDNGLSTWTMESFNPQAVGYAYVENNDFVISGTNCNWSSGDINISSEEEIAVSFDLRCDQPLRLNSNDTLSIYYSVDDGEKTLIKRWTDDFEAQRIQQNGVKIAQLLVVSRKVKTQRAQEEPDEGNPLGRVIGVFNVSSERIGAFGEDDVRIISALGNQIAIAIENTRLLNAATARAGRSQRGRHATQTEHAGEVQESGT